VQLVRLLDRHGVTAFWLTQEQTEKLEQLWQWDACIRQVQGDGNAGGLKGQQIGASFRKRMGA